MILNQLNNSEFTKKIGRGIFILRHNKGLSREELACRIGVSQQQIFKYEMGKNRITIDRLITILLALESRLADLFALNEFEKEIYSLIIPKSFDQFEILNNFIDIGKLSTKELAINLLRLLSK